jgi:hypothetical protein
MKPEKRGQLTVEAATDLAAAGLMFVAEDPEHMGRFLALTGLEPHMLRAASAEPGFLAGVLDYFLGHEPTLLAFAAYANVPPAEVATARRILAPEDYEP